MTQNQAVSPPTAPTQFPPQHQNRQPGLESEMNPLPQSVDPTYVPSGKLTGKCAIITGGDSGIGRAVSILFAKEGADIVIGYLNEHRDAEETKRIIESSGGHAELLPGDIGEESVCQALVELAIRRFGRLDILVNNAAEQHPQPTLLQITREQLERTFRTNLFSFFYLTKAALPHLGRGSSIINTTSVTAYEGMPTLIDYSATKGGIMAFTRSLSKSLAPDGIRVNGIAPGPIWTPLIPSTFTPTEVAKFGSDTPLKRAGQPRELAPAYVYLASDDSSYMTGQVLHVNGGTAVSG